MLEHAGDASAPFAANDADLLKELFVVSKVKVMSDAARKVRRRAASSSVAMSASMN